MFASVDGPSARHAADRAVVTFRACGNRAKGARRLSRRGILAAQRNGQFENLLSVNKTRYLCLLSQRELPVLRLVRLGMARAGGRGFAARRMRCLRALWQATRVIRAFSDGGFRFTGKAFAMYGLKTESSFDAAHFLTDYHGKCENLHGHRWRVVAYLEQAELQTCLLYTSPSPRD